MELIIPELLGDNWLLKEWDWELDGSPQSILDKIRSLPQVDITNYQNRNQIMSHRRWETGCTWVSGMNLIWTIMWEELTDDLMNEAEQTALADWWRHWYWWWRWAGTNVARKMWNKYHPDNQVQTYLVRIDSPEAIAYLDSWRPLHTSINVNHRFWAYAYWWLVNKSDFSSWTGHATIHKDWDWYKLFLDSAGFRRDDKFWVKYKVTDNVMDIKLNQLKTLRNDVHIVLPDNIIPMIASDVPTGQRYSEAIDWLIKEWLTTETKKFRPSDNVTRAEMAVFMKRLYDKINKEHKND